MPSVSYLRNNDYTPQQFRPFELPYNALLQNIATKTAYWQQGVAQIQQQHKNALGLDPMFSQNKEYLKNFMNEANKKLALVAKSDLSVQDNAAQGKTVFAPLYDTSNEFNANLLEDAGLNKFYQEQDKITKTSRTSNGGKDYSQTNEAYWRNHYNEYINAAASGQDPAKIKEFSQKRKGYIPYYDISDDVKEAIKNCHPSSSETQEEMRGNSLYLHNVKSKGVSEENMQGCLSFMPEKAKQQIQIESSVKYYNNKEGLANDYKYLVKDRYAESANALKAKIAAMKLGKNPNKEYIAQAEQLLIQKEQQVSSVNKEWEGMISQNGADFINRNFDQIAGQIGWNHFTTNAGKVYSYSEVSNKLSPNAAGMLERRLEADSQKFRIGEQNDFIKLGMSQNHDFKLEEAKHQNRLLEEANKEGKVDKNGMIVPSASPVILNADSNEPLDDGMGKKNFETELLNQETLLKQNEDAFKRVIAGQLGKDIKDLTESEVINFTTTVESGEINDPIVKIALNSLSKSRIDLQNAKERAKTVAETNVNERNKIFGGVRKNYSNLITNTGGPVNLSERELAGMIDGNILQASDGTRFRVKKGDFLDNLTKRATFKGLNMYKSMNGYNMEKQLSNGTWTSVINKDMMDDIDNLDNKFKGYAKAADQNYNKSLIGISPVFDPNFTKKQRDEVEENAAVKLGLQGNPNFKVSVQYQDEKGAGMVKILEKKGEDWAEIDYDTFLEGKDGLATSVSGWAYRDKDGKNLTHLKVNDLVGALPYQEIEKSQPIAEFTNNRINSIQNGEKSKDYFNHITSAGTQIRVAFTKIQNSPIYTIERFYNGAYQKINIPVALTTPQAVAEALKNIDTL